MSTSSAPASDAARARYTFAAFIVMGVFDGTLGVAWPSMRQDLHQPLAALGVLLVASDVTFLTVNLLVDQVLDRAGLRGALAGGSAFFAVSLLMIGLGSWPVVVLGAAAWGVATGLINAAINVYSTVRMTGSTIQVLHGLWGVGTLLGPLLVTGSLLAGFGWRPPLFLVATGELGLLVWAVLGPRWADPRTPSPRSGRARLTVPLLMASAAFFLYTAAEWTGGQWSFTVLTESRGFSTAAAGLLVSLYWTGLTAGRLLGGLAGLRVATEALLATGLGVAILAAAGFWLLPAASAVELPLLGFGLAPVYPALMKLTQGRVSGGAVGFAVGLQTAAGGTGSALAPAAVGLAMQRFGLSLMAPLVLTLAVATAGAGLLAELPGRRR